MLNSVKKLQAHKSVLLEEVIESLGLQAHLNEKLTQEKPKYIDTTVGFGGHSAEIVRKGGVVLGIDADGESLKIAEQKIKEACPASYLVGKEPFTLVCENFIHLGQVAKKYGFDEVDGILFDLGVSTWQLTSPTRGISFQNKNALLDMRLNKDTQNIKGSDLLNSLNKEQLLSLFETTLSHHISQKLAREVITRRQKAPIQKAGDFLSIISVVIHRSKKLNVATLPFLALRIAVNSELENLKSTLPQALDLLKVGGRLVVISFHSGEDRVVKSLFKKFGEQGKAKVITVKPIMPSEREIAENFKSRSAKMRVLQKI